MMLSWLDFFTYAYVAYSYAPHAFSFRLGIWHSLQNLPSITVNIFIKTTCKSTDKQLFTCELSRFSFIVWPVDRNKTLLCNVGLNKIHAFGYPCYSL